MSSAVLTAVFHQLLRMVVGLTLLYATPFLHNLPEATRVIVTFAVIPLIKIKKSIDFIGKTQALEL